MRKILSALALILGLSAPALGQEINVGHSVEKDCGFVSFPRRDGYWCYQTEDSTDGSGRVKGKLYVFKGADLPVDQQWQLYSVSGGGGTIDGSGAANRIAVFSDGDTLATSAGITANLGTNAITATTFVGALTGNASTASALSSNPTNCPSGEAPQGIDASGNAENCQILSAGGDVTAVLGTLNEIESTNSGGPQPVLAFPSTVSVPTKIFQFGRLELIGDISPTTITADQHDYNPTGLSTASTLRLNTDASRNLTGLQGGSDGRVLTLHNVGAFALVLVNESGSSGAANRFALSANLTVAPNQSIVLQYDGLSSRWRVISASSSAIDQAASYNWTGTHTFNQIVNLAASSPAQLTADQNNYALGNTVVHRISTDDVRTITGFVAPAAVRIAFIANVGGEDLVLANESGSSTDVNRIATITGGDLAVPAGALALLIYDTTTERWRAFSMRDFVTVEADTGSSVFARNRIVDVCNSFANSCRFVDSSGDGIAIYRSAANGPVITCVIGGVENDCDKVVKLNTGRFWEVRNNASAALFKITEAGAMSGLAIRRAAEVVPFDFGTDVTTGTGKFFFRVPPPLDNMNLVSVAMNVVTAGTTGVTEVNLQRCAAAASGNACSGTTADMLSTNLTVDSGENDSATAATPAVIDAANRLVTSGQLIRVDVGAVSTTAPKGLIVTMEFQGQ